MDNVDFLNNYWTKIKIAYENYSKSKKYYHTIYHIYDIIENFAKNKNKFLDEFPNLNLEILTDAIIFHDIIYIPGNNDNEEKSVELYNRYNNFNKQVSQVIISTKIGVTEFKTPEEKVMHDLDWFGFSEAQMMVENENKIFLEAFNAGFNKNVIIENQLKFYKSIENINIYQTKTFSKYNSFAIKNIKNRIFDLQKLV